MYTGPVPSSVWKATLRAAHAHLLAIGEVTYAASTLQDSFYQIFLLVISMERRFDDPRYQVFSKGIFQDHALAIWHSLQSDHHQREMALAALVSLPSHLKLRRTIKSLQWAKTKASKLAEYRNLLAHTPIKFRWDDRKSTLVPVFSGHGMRKAHQRKLELVGGLQLWRTIRNDLLNLSNYVDGVCAQCERLGLADRGVDLVGPSRTWPGKPRLRSLRRLHEISTRSSPPASPTARRPRRRPASKRSP